jgi:transcriptional antiterminator
VKITHRQIAILYELLEAETPLTASILGSRLDMNERMVRFNLPSIDLWLQKQGVKKGLQFPKGIYLEIPGAKRNQLLKMFPEPLVEDAKIFLRPEYRQLWLTFRILASVQPLHSKDFEKELDLSENTLARDLAQVRMTLEKHGLMLIRKRSVGTYVEGPEIQIRYALSIVLKKILGEANIVHLCLWKQVKLQNPWTERGLLVSMTLNMINEWAPWDSWKEINHLTSVLGVKYDEVNISRIALYLAISIQRIRSECSVEYPPERIEDIQDNELFATTKKFIKNPQFASDIQLSDSELAYLFNQLVTYHYEGFGNEYEHLGDISPESLMSVAEEIMKAVYVSQGLDYKTSAVTRDLGAHLHRCYNLLHLGVKVHFELADDVRRGYSDLYEEVSRITQKLSVNPLFGTILKEEVARITLYAAMAIMLDETARSRPESKIIVVCPTGGITSRILMLRLETELPELGDLELMSLKQLSSSNLDNVAAIISTTKTIEKDYQVPVIVVNPFLEPLDITRLKTWILGQR